MKTCIQCNFRMRNSKMKLYYRYFHIQPQYYIIVPTFGKKGLADKDTSRGCYFPVWANRDVSQVLGGFSCIKFPKNGYNFPQILSITSTKVFCLKFPVRK